MEDIFRRLSELLEPMSRTMVPIIDVLLVTLITYRILTLIRGRRAWRLVGGIATFALALILSDYFQLRTLHWLLDKATLLAPVALAILLLPELRQALEAFGKLGLWPDRFRSLGEEPTDAHTVEELVAACWELSSQRTGALIIVERGARLDEIAGNGVAVHAKVSAPLLGSIFYHGNPLHDGATIIRGDQIAAAACRLPLSENMSLDSHLHMRHRAGLGISEQADCVALIVSEERGSISAAMDGRLFRLDSPSTLRDFLNGEVRGVGKRLEKPRKRRKDAEKVEAIP